MDKFSEYKKFFENQTDISETVCRAPIYSYCADTDEPILFRHYLHKCETCGLFGETGPKQNNRLCTIFIIIDVSFDFITENNLYTPKCGDIVLISGVKNVYRLNIYDARTVNYYEINIPTAVFDIAPQFKVLKDLFYGEDVADTTMLTLSHEEQTEVFRLLCEIEAEIAEKRNYYDSTSFAYLLQIAAIICTNRTSQHNSVSLHLVPPLRNAIKYISENYLKIETTEQVANHCHISVSYLCRIFKNYLGTSPVDYINSLKISYAKYLLESGRNVTEACYESGFNSYNYFISIFKKTVGKTPGEYAHKK